MSVCGATKGLAALILITWGSGRLSHAGLVTFELHNPIMGDYPPSLDGKSTGTYTVGGLTGTFSATPGKMNGTKGSWGINAPGSDASSQIDDASGKSEFLTISFSESITFETITFSATTDDDIVDMTIGSNPLMSLTGPDTATFSSNNFVALGESVTIAHNSGNGVSLDSFQVQNATSTPEPSSLALSLLALGALGLRRFRSARSAAFWSMPVRSVGDS